MSSLGDLARAADHKRTLAPCGDIEGAMLALGKKARAAASLAGNLTTAQKNGALHAMAARLASSQADILTANKVDLAQMEEDGRKDAYIRRAKLDSGRIETIIADLHKIADLNDPVGEVIANWERPNGLRFERVRTPLGVIGVIFESRPNVTVDAGALCFKSGNAVILRGGSDCYATNQALLRALRAGLTDYAIDENIIQIVETRARDAVGMMLQGLNGAIDVIVPRGGKSLVARVEAEAAIPVFAHLEGICHMFIDRFADCDMARDLAVNAKMRRPEICGALETLLIHRDCVDTHLTPILSALAAAGCEIRGDMSVCNIFPPAKVATQQDWQSEYLDAIIAVRVVDGLDEAIYHIQTYGSGHTDAIVTENEERAQTFLTRVDSAIVMHNASTQFADGGEFGFGAEIGISTGRMHARGPIGLEQLTSFNYRVRGQGQTRP